MEDWEGILERDGPHAWRAAWRILGHHADADECFQDACLAALELSRGQKVRNWRAVLQRLAAARAIDQLRIRIRRKPREQPLPEGHLTSGDALPPDRAAHAELAARLRAALAHLPSRQAEV